MAKKKKGVPLWKRVVAYILDSFLISFIILTPFSSGFESNVEELSLTSLWSSISSSLTTNYLLLTLAITLLILLYWSFLEYHFGQTVGKILLRIQVVSSNKKPLTYWQAIVRNVTKLSSILIIFDTLYMLIKKTNQRYFEVISSTTVVEEKR